MVEELGQIIAQALVQDRAVQAHALTSLAQVVRSHPRPGHVQWQLHDALGRTTQFPSATPASAAGTSPGTARGPRRKAGVADGEAGLEHRGCGVSRPATASAVSRRGDFRWSARRLRGCRAGRRSGGACCPAGPGRPAKVRCEPPFEGPDVRAVDRCVIHVQQTRRPQLSQEHLVQLRPDARFGSSPANVARPSHHCSRPGQPEHLASSRSCTARKRCPAAQPGHPPATARDTDTASPDEQAAAEPHVPTGHQGQDQQTPTRSCRHNTQPPSPTTNFILKRSVRRVRWILSTPRRRQRSRTEIAWSPAWSASTRSSNNVSIFGPGVTRVPESCNRSGATPWHG